MLFTMRSGQEQQAPSQKDMLLVTSKMSIQMRTMKKKLFIAKALTEENAFLIDYLDYMVQLYQGELQNNVTYKGVAKTLFTKTYYNQKQS